MDCRQVRRNFSAHNYWNFSFPSRCVFSLKISLLISYYILLPKILTYHYLSYLISSLLATDQNTNTCITCLIFSFSGNFLSIYSICENPIRLWCHDFHPHLQLSYSFRLPSGQIVWAGVPKIVNNRHWDLFMHFYNHGLLSHLGWQWASRFDCS